MRCGIHSCPGTYRDKLVMHATRFQGNPMIFDRVPAEVCDICGDTLFSPATMKAMERVKSSSARQDSAAPVFILQRESA